MYSVAYKYGFTLSLTNIPVYSPCDGPLYHGLLTDTLGNSVAGRSLYRVAYSQDSDIFIIVNQSQPFHIEKNIMYFLCSASCLPINQSVNHRISDVKFSNTMLDCVFTFKFSIAVLSTKMPVG